MDISISNGMCFADSHVKLPLLAAFADRGTEESASAAASESDEEPYDDVITHTTMQEDTDGFTLIVVETLPDGTNRQTTIQAGRCQDDQVAEKPLSQIPEHAKDRIGTGAETARTDLLVDGRDLELCSTPLATSNAFPVGLDIIREVLPVEQGVNINDPTNIESATVIAIHQVTPTVLNSAVDQTDTLRNAQSLPADEIGNTSGIGGTHVNKEILCLVVDEEDKTVYATENLSHISEELICLAGNAGTLPQDTDAALVAMVTPSNSLEVLDKSIVEYVEETIATESQAATSGVASSETECASTEIASLPAANDVSLVKHKARLNYTRPSKRDKLYQCSECQKRFTTLSSCRDHVFSHTGFKPHQCDICGMTFTAKGTLRGHLLTHKNRKQHTCPHCGKYYAVRKTLVAHMTKHLSVTADKPFACRKCDTSFATVSERDVHSKSRTLCPRVIFQCPECDKDFLHNSHLQRHLKTHTGDKPFACTYCTKRFAQKGNLTKHLWQHSDHKPYTCSQCGKAYVYKAYLSEHLKTHNGPHDNTWKCSGCQKCFRYQCFLLRHKRRCPLALLTL